MGFLKHLLRKQRTAGNRPTSSHSTKPTKSATSRNKVVLPSELVLYIFHLAAEEDPTSLPLFALLCTATRHRAQVALYTCPTLRNLWQVSLFIRTVRKNARLAAMVRRIVLDGRSGTTDSKEGDREKHSPLTSRLAKVLEVCKGVEALECWNVSVFSLLDFGQATNLKHLSLTACVLSDRTTTARYQRIDAPLPKLETLTLRRVQFDPSTAEHFLCPRILPKLVALDLDGCRLVEDPATLTDLGKYEPAQLADQLELLQISGEPEEDPSRPQPAARRNRDEPDPFDLVSKCSNLRTLALPVNAVTAEVLEHLPVEQLTHLKLVPPSHGRPDVLETHLSAALALSTSFLTLATTAPPSLPYSLSTSPFASRSPLSTSIPSSPLALSPFSSRGPSPSANAARAPLSQLLELTLPESWDVEFGRGQGTWKENGEVAWAVGRILRECGRREVEVRFADWARGAGGWSGMEGGEMVQELRRVRQAVLAA
ncbi:hypothetical protein JCM11251_001228 [Rhodosporidiobolus azoricus]